MKKTVLLLKSGLDGVGRMQREGQIGFRRRDQVNKQVDNSIGGRYGEGQHAGADAGGRGLDR